MTKIKNLQITEIKNIQIFRAIVLTPDTHYHFSE
jgi:hypothetical protein